MVQGTFCRTFRGCPVTYILQADTGDQGKVAASRSLTLKGGKQQGHCWVREGLKTDSILGICIQLCESCVQPCSAYLCLTFTAGRVVFIVVATAEQAPGFFYCQRERVYSPSDAAC